MPTPSHKPGDTCRTQDAVTRIQKLIDRWWDSPKASRQRTELADSMHFISACAQCRATMAERVIFNGMRTIEQRLEQSVASIPAEAYAQVVPRRRPGKPN